MSDFNTFWRVYPKRRGANPRNPAEKKWYCAIKNGADPYHMVSSARKYADELRQMNKLDTEYVCMAQTWLNQKRWLDYALDLEGEKLRQDKLDADMARRGWKWDGDRWQQVNGHFK